MRHTWDHISPGACRDMEREITQLCSLEGEVLGALEWLKGIDDAYARQKNVVGN